MNSFQKMSLAFRETGGVHSAALSDGEHILVFKEDIGRHNALDKASGAALLKGINPKCLIVLISGRISSEIIGKAKRLGAPFVISRSAPTDQAIKIARATNITLIGFARGNRMNIYSGEKRVVAEL